MSGNKFVTARVDGRSNAQVIIDHVKDGEPGRVYPYAELAAVLEAGMDRPFGVKDVCSAVRQATPRLLREQQRALYNIKGTGHRLALASEHRGLALVRKRRSDVQLRHCLTVARHVRDSEMTEAQRVAHYGTLMHVEALYANQVVMDKRLRYVEAAVASIVKKKKE